MIIVSMLSPKDRSERDYDGFSLDEIYEMGWNDCKFKMEEIDAVPVVRCKDCRNSWYDELFGMRWCNGKRCMDDWYCADGKR